MKNGVQFVESKFCVRCNTSAQHEVKLLHIDIKKIWGLNFFQVLCSITFFTMKFKNGGRARGLEGLEG